MMTTTTPTPIAFLGNYPPRRCGIATFTHDLCEAVARQGGEHYEVYTVAMNDVPEGYPYPERVRFEIRQSVQADYRLAAEYLNIHQASVVCLQHEYGIFGGTCGSHLLGLLRRLRRPMVATLHTVLKNPNEQQLVVMKEIARLSSRLVVMSEIAHDLLHDVFKVPQEKIITIPHGIPDVPFVDPSFFKDKFNVEGRKVMLTFGLLSPGKGIEYAIEAMPKIVQKHPELIYIVLGATHPHIKRENGEEYRNSLFRRVNELGLQNNVLFVNRFVSLEELCEYLGATDIYITPYLNEAQITSGTLAYALGTGKATISTPYWHATELLAENRGRLVPFRDSDAIAREVSDLLENEVERHAMRKRAYNHCRKMAWNRVAQSYLDLFEAAKQDFSNERTVQVSLAETTHLQKEDDLPEIDLRHLQVMTDDTGIFQHCRYSTPDRSHGYCTDDNARALITSAMYWDQTHDESIVKPMQTYLSFLAYAMDNETGRFRNFMDYGRKWTEVSGSEDSHGRALWGLGVGVALCPHESMIGLATSLFKQGLPIVENFFSPRAWAFTIIGIHAYLRRFGGDSEVRRYRERLTLNLVELFQNNMTSDWPWCESTATYANAKLPHALLMSGKWMQRNDIIDLGKRSLSWLIDVQTNQEGMLSIIGTDGWYHQGHRARFDQQPIEAHALLEACIEAYHVTREPYWIEQAYKAFNWFLGDNDLRTPIYDFTTGGCRDGLHEDRVNENQGAESTLSWLMSLLLMNDLQMEQTLGELAADKHTGQRPVKKAISSSGPVTGVKEK